jgi:hypothetical protein
LLTSDQIEETLDVINATSNNGAARNYLHGRFGKFVNIIKIAYLHRRENGLLDSTKDDIDHMMDNFELSNEISFVSLSDVPVKEYFELYDNHKELPSITDMETITVSMTKQFSGVAHYRELNEIDDETKSLSKQIRDERCERQLKKEDALFIAVAWIVKPAFRLFKLCPEVVWLDVTSHSNSKGFHLLTFSSRLSIGKQIVWMWIFIPNQQRFSFRWVFQVAIPNLVPKWLRDRVLFFMKDGDPQQRNEILFSMKKHFINATEGTCGFHVMHMGWKKNVPTCTNLLSPTNMTKWTRIVSHIHEWVYSWMNPGNVEDKDEYLISKYLLEQFITSKSVLDIVEGNTFLIGRILKFLRCHVYTWESLYLHYERKTIRHFDTSHSSPHEGTNHGLKSHSAGVKATMNLDLSAKTLNTQTSIRVAECDELIYQEATKTHKKWSNLPTSKYIVSVAEGIMQVMMSRSNKYDAKLVGKTNGKYTFEVTYTPEVDMQESRASGELSLIPRFERLRIVTVNQDERMFCSCCHFERMGLPCVHQATVATMCLNSQMNSCQFQGFTHHDISVRWWTKYMYYAYKSSTPSDIMNKFHQLALKDISGPKICCTNLNAIEIFTANPHLPAIERLKNYSKTDVSIDHLNEYILTTGRIHLSQLDDFESNILFNNMAESNEDTTGGHLNDMFSESIMNYDFAKENEITIKARYSLKQLWQESCAEADNIGPEGIKELERQLLLFRQFCNQNNISTTDKGLRLNVPMTNGHYGSRVTRVYNTHNM